MKCEYCNNEIQAGATKCNSCNAAVKNSSHHGTERYPFKPLDSGLAEKVRQFAEQEFNNADFSQSGNVYVNGNIPALELGRARKKIAPALTADEAVLFLWADKKFKNGLMVTDHRVFYKVGWFKKGAVNWSDAKSMMFKRSFGNHVFSVNGKKLFCEETKKRTPGAVKDVLNRFFYGVLTGLFGGDQDKVPPVDFGVKEQKEKRRNAVIGGLLASGANATLNRIGKQAMKGVIGSANCTHSPIGEHAFINGVCRYCGKKAGRFD